MTEHAARQSAATLRGSPWPSAATWFALAMLLVIVAGFGLRYGTNILDYPHVRDERLMKAPIDDIVTQGWSIDTAINYQEVKGPAFFWPYALGAQVLGNEMNDLRLITVLFFIGSALPLLMVMVRCGCRGPTLVAAAAFYVLLPYSSMVGQILMSEPSFIFFAMWLVWVFVWGFGDPRDPARPERRLWGPLFFAVLLSILLHSRPHAVAFAGAAALVAFERDGLRSWPWWLACVLAGLSRLPLWLHWGGLVTSDYQDLFDLGFRIDPATYLFAAALPLTWLFLWRGFSDPVNRPRRWWVYAGAALGLALGLFFRPDVNAMAQYLHPGLDEIKQQQLYAGITTTALRTLVPTGLPHALALIALATLGGGAIGAMLAVTWGRDMLVDGRAVVMRLACWTLVVGIAMFMLTSGPVYDRYLQVWAIVLPAVWLWSVPRWLLILHGLLLAAIAVHLVVEWLVRSPP